jgi:hypothetical protein
MTRQDVMTHLRCRPAAHAGLGCDRLYSGVTCCAVRVVEKPVPMWTTSSPLGLVVMRGHSTTCKGSASRAIQRKLALK